MIAVTGAAGFIGSAMTAQLQLAGYNNILAVDDFTKVSKAGNLSGRANLELKDRSEFPDWLNESGNEVHAVFHLGARTDTTEFDESIFDELNFRYSQKVWNACVKHRIPLFYASSAATYGNGSLGFSDDIKLIPKLQPLNPYGWSKQKFDLWVLEQENSPPRWAGFKFFNVYGPNEYHKGRMASVILHAFRQIFETGRMKLFRSHHQDFKDGEQKRDFIYVKDVVQVLQWFLDNNAPSDIYNLGTGQARTFMDLTKATFRAMEKPPQIEFIDTPEDIRNNYQYYTEADMQKLKTQASYSKSFTPLEKGVEGYVTNYLLQHAYI